MNHLGSKFCARPLAAPIFGGEGDSRMRYDAIGQSNQIAQAALLLPSWTSYNAGSPGADQPIVEAGWLTEVVPQFNRYAPKNILVTNLGENNFAGGYPSVQALFDAIVAYHVRARAFGFFTIDQTAPPALAWTGNTEVNRVLINNMKRAQPGYCDHLDDIDSLSYFADPNCIYDPVLFYDNIHYTLYLNQILGARTAAFISNLYPY